jgi:selenocysteine-specific elongation factor
MKHVILGTAGHIDHGKTSLIKLFTGIDTDRLKEEKIRGMTTDLGFTHFRLPNGNIVGIIDVPGHERFIKTMVAGAYCIDLVIFVVASDEGIMPQTVEHMYILNLLGVTRGIVVLTKTDLVEREWVDFIKEEVRNFVKGSFLENSPIIPISSKTGEGKDELIKLINIISEEIENRECSGIFRLPIDRIFTIRGFGTIVTGTVIDGEVSINDSVEILPKRIVTKVRGIEIYNEKSTHSSAGFRTAINLKGVEKSIIERGDILAHPDIIRPSLILDVSINALNKSIKNNSIINFHIGTSKNIGRIVLLDKDKLKEYERGYAQIRLNAPVVAMPKDRFIIRSSGVTLGGGEVLDSHPQKHKRFDKTTLSNLDVYRNGDDRRIIENYILNSNITNINYIRIDRNLPLHKISTNIENMVAEGILIKIDSEIIHKDNLYKLKSIILDNIKLYHKNFPLKMFISKEDLRAKLPDYINNRVFSEILSMLNSSGEIFMDGNNIRLSDHKVIVEEDIKSKIVERFENAGLTPPMLKDLCNELKISIDNLRDIISILLRENVLIRVKYDLYFYKERVDNLKESIKDYSKGKKELSVKDFKNITNISRKFLIPLLEYFDSIKFTVRIGDKRRIK